MPLGLDNPEGMFPSHYDPKYEPGTNTFDSRPLNIKDVIQSIAKKMRSYPLGKEDLQKAHIYLDKKHMLQRNPGDQEVQETIKEFVKALTSSRRVAAKWLI